MPEQIKVTSGDETFGLTLPDNGRLRVARCGTLEFCEPQYPGMIAQRWHKIYSPDKDAQCFSAAWFSDACDNAAEWHVEDSRNYAVYNVDGQCGHIINPDEHFDANQRAEQWRAAKRAHLALER